MTDIQWFPGHMQKAYKAISKLIKEIDVVVEILDARIPHSSVNPLLRSIIHNTKTIKLLNKSDLADPNVTTRWINYFNNLDTNTTAISSSKFDSIQISGLLNKCKKLAPNRNSFVKPLRVMISGVPNVGKSTLINKLSSRHCARTGDMPALTRGILTLNLQDDLIVYDTPGLTWHKFDEQITGYNLALCNSIGRNALDFELLALYLLDHMLKYHPEALEARYKIIQHSSNSDADKDAKPHAPEKLLETLAHQFGAIKKNQRLDIQKISELVVQDFRNGKLGKISLEHP